MAATPDTTFGQMAGERGFLSSTTIQWAIWAITVARSLQMEPPSSFTASLPDRSRLIILGGNDERSVSSIVECAVAPSRLSGKQVGSRNGAELKRGRARLEGDLRRRQTRNAEECPQCGGGLNRSTQHLPLESKDQLSADKSKTLLWYEAGRENYVVK